MADAFTQALQELSRQAGVANANARKAYEIAGQVDARNARIEQEMMRQQRAMSDLSDALASVKGTGGQPMSSDHIQYIEQLPGRRVPFSVVVRIPFGANITSEQQGTYTITQDGPFVAVRRQAIFLSQYQFSYTDPQTGGSAVFAGRSFGRFRPVHSAWDLNDTSAGALQPTTGGPMPGAGLSIYASASNLSGFRTMEFDGLVRFQNQGTAYPRQNDAIPSAWYTEQINSPYDLPALDFFEKSEVLQWLVTPTHANNAGAGNVSGFGATSLYPFLDSQYDVAEGINDPEDARLSTDPITRLPNGILFIGFEGYRIINPPGVVR